MSSETGDYNSSLVLNDSYTNGTPLAVNSEHYYGSVHKSIFGTWLSLIILLSIIGNLLVMLAIALTKDLRKLETNMFLFNLALSDIMVGISMAPVSLYTLFHEEWHLGDSLCTLNLFLNTAFLFISVHTLMYISIHKYVTVRRLADCDKEPVKRCVCYSMIAASWMWGLAFGFIASVWLGKAEYKIKTTQCGPMYPTLTGKSVALSVTNVVLNFLIPFGIMVIMYGMIYRIMKETTAFRRQSMRRDSEVKTHSAQHAAVNTLKIVLICFVVCWLPYLIYMNYVFFKADRSSIPAFLNPLAYCFGFTSSVCNPIIYALRFPDFRKGYCQIISKMTCNRYSNWNVQKRDLEDRTEKIDLI